LASIGTVNKEEFKPNPDLAQQILEKVSGHVVQLLALLQAIKLPSDFSTLPAIKSVFLDCLIWGGALTPLLNAVVDCLKEVLPSMKKKKGKVVPELDQLNAECWMPLKQQVIRLSQEFDGQAAALNKVIQETKEGRRAHF